jgi:S-adenosylmethionine synthetase
VLDAILELDPNARVACETAVTTGMVLVMGEVNNKLLCGYSGNSKNKSRISDMTERNLDLIMKHVLSITSIHEQSPDIAVGVDNSKKKKSGMDDSGYELGAGDQGMVFGYACSDTQEKCPWPFHYLMVFAEKLAEVRKTGKLRYLSLMGKLRSA